MRKLGRAHKVSCGSLIDFHLKCSGKSKKCASGETTEGILEAPWFHEVKLFIKASLHIHDTDIGCFGKLLGFHPFFIVFLYAGQKFH